MCYIEFDNKYSKWGTEMIHIAICDVVKREVEVLEKRLYDICEDICGDNVHISVFNNTFALVTHIIDEIKGQIDIVFMEVRHGDFDGISAARTILSEYPHIKIIFMSGNISNSKDIFKVNPTYFLTKPIEDEYLCDALHKAARLVNETNIDIIRIGNGIGKNCILTIKMKDIYYIKSDKRKITFYTTNGQHTCYMKLNDVSEKLTSNFIRVHQSYIVNMDRIKSVKTGNVMLNKDVIIPISSSRAKPVVKSIKEYMKIS